MFLLNLKVNGQASSVSHTNVYLDWLGWNAGYNSPLYIRNDLTSPPNHIEFYTNLSKKMTILGSNASNDGFVGIGKNWTPAHLLDVWGGDINTGDANSPACTTAYMMGDLPILWHNGVTTRLYVGIGAGNSSASGVNNTCIGYNTGNSLTTGEDNTFTGMNAALNLTIGSYNTAIGFESLKVSTNGNNNTATGYKTLTNNTTGTFNTANGSYALLNNLTGLSNTAIGGFALMHNTYGGFSWMQTPTGPRYSNTAVGFRSPDEVGVPIPNALANSLPISNSIAVNRRNLSYVLTRFQPRHFYPKRLCLLLNSVLLRA